MNSKIKQLRELIRGEIKRALQEEDGQSQEQIAAAAALQQAQEKMAKADIEAARKRLANAKELAKAKK